LKGEVCEPSGKGEKKGEGKNRSPALGHRGVHVLCPGNVQRGITRKKERLTLLLVPQRKKEGRGEQAESAPGPKKKRSFPGGKKSEKLLRKVISLNKKKKKKEKKGRELEWQKKKKNRHLP